MLTYMHRHQECARPNRKFAIIYQLVDFQDSVTSAIYWLAESDSRTGHAEPVVVVGAIYLVNKNKQGFKCRWRG